MADQDVFQVGKLELFKQKNGKAFIINYRYFNLFGHFDIKFGGVKKLELEIREICIFGKKFQLSVKMSQLFSYI